MAKRFTDTEKWRRPWFRNLPMPYRELWSYLLDTCDMIGVWYVDIGLASYSIGHQVTEEEALKHFDKQLTVIDKTRWFIKGFVAFQYGALVASNNMHRSVIARLNALNLLGPDQALTCPSRGAQDKDKVKVKDKVKSLQIVGQDYKIKELAPIQRVVNAYKIAIGIDKDDKAWDKERFARCSKPAKSLLELFGDWHIVVEYLIRQGSEFDQKGLTWTLETIAKTAWDNKGKLNALGIAKQIQK